MIAGIRPWRLAKALHGTTAPAVRNVEAAEVRTPATPDKRSAAGDSLKGTKPHERRIAWPVFAAAYSAAWAKASASDPDDRVGDRHRVWSCAGGSARRCGDHRTVDTDGLSRRRSRSQWESRGKGEAYARDATRRVGRTRRPKPIGRLVPPAEIRNARTNREHVSGAMDRAMNRERNRKMKRRPLARSASAMTRHSAPIAGNL